MKHDFLIVLHADLTLANLFLQSHVFGLFIYKKRGRYKETKKRRYRRVQGSPSSLVLGYNNDSKLLLVAQNE